MSARTALLLLALLLLPSAAVAGGGPETTLIVVNADSPVSRLVANEYVKLRQIPPENVVHLTGIPHCRSVTLDFFLKRIWSPIESFMEERGIEDRIDLISYSADFPFQVGFPYDAKGKTPQQRQIIGGHASLNGLTYLIRHVLDGDDFFDLALNHYYRVGPGRTPRPLRAPTSAEQNAAAKAEQAMRQKQHDKAAKAYATLLRTYKWAPDAWYNYACCLAILKRLEEAFKALEQAAKAGFANAAHAQQDPDLVSLRRDPRFRGAIQGIAANSARFLPSHGFRSAYGWNREAIPAKDGGETKHRYYLSTHLAYTGFKGNSVPEILRYLRSAAAADGTRPDGTVYICRNTNVRSTARAPFFSNLVGTLGRMGRKVQILDTGKDGQDGILPKRKDDVVGAVIGTAGFNWVKSRSKILPGAIVEHLTSFGADFNTKSQTKCTEFLRHGAAGTSGVVREPLAIHFKFPNPMIHAFYAEGSSLAEAFYQSVGGPYQLMIIGDGLARPFATFPDLSLDVPPQPLTGTVTLEPRAEDCTFELWADGRFVTAGKKLEFDSRKLMDGHHDLRVVAVATDRIESRKTVRASVIVANSEAGGEVEYLGEAKVPFGQPLEFRGPPSAEMAILSGSLVIAEGKDRVSVDSRTVGPGPVILTPILRRPNGDWRGRPVEVEIVPPAIVAPPKDPGHPRKPGLGGRVLTVSGERPTAVLSVGDKRSGPTLKKLLEGVKATKLTLTGEMEAPEDGFYQIRLMGRGKASLTVSGTKLVNHADLASPAYGPVWLGEGWHPLEIVLETNGPAELELMWGGDRVLGTPRLRHWSHPALARPPEIEDVAEGAPIVVPEDGLVLSWKRSISNLAAVTLFPKKDAALFPARWIVEVPAGRNRWKTVKDLQQVAASRPKAAPAFVELSFHPVKTKRLRIRPAEAGKPVTLERVEALGKR